MKAQRPHADEQQQKDERGSFQDTRGRVLEGVLIAPDEGQDDSDVDDAQRIGARSGSVFRWPATSARPSWKPAG
jgi:hypothetical protein